MPRDSGDTRDGTVERRDLLKSAIVGATTVGVAGCRSLGSEGPGGGGGASPGSENVPKDLFKGETLKIGGMWPLPDDYTIGRDAQRGAALAVKEHNQSSNGVLGADLQLINRSTGISPAQSRQNTRELCLDEDVDVLNGGFLGQSYKLMMEPIASTQTLSYFSCGASIPVVEKMKGNFQRHKYNFRSIGNMAQARDAELNFLEAMADRMDWNRIAVFTENLEVFDAVADPLVQGIRERDIAEVPLAKRTSQSIINWNPLFDQAEEANCDLVCINLVLTGMTAARQWGTSERPFDLGGIHLLAMAPDFWEAVGRVAPGLWTLNMGALDSRQTPEMIPMQERFKQEYGYKTSAYSCFCAYDAVNNWVEAVKATGSTDPADLIPYLEQRTWRGSILKPTVEYYDEGTQYPHDIKWSAPTIEKWNELGFPPIIQWQGDKNGEAGMKTVAPKRAAGGQYKMQKTPWLE
jgi:branched-chain amino acid transport system substrate-binding protein